MAKKKKAPVRHAPWTGDMLPRSVGEGRKIGFRLMSCASSRIEWVSRALNDAGSPATVRIPKEKTRKFIMKAPFIAAGKFYLSWKQLVHEADETKIWCRDIYGREVLFLAERFPCFDSSDAIHENRFYRWFFLREDQKLTRVSFADGDVTICVTEDVADVEWKCWREIQRLGWFSQKEDA